MRCTSAAFTREGTWEAAGARAAGAGRPRRHRARGDAGRRFHRPLRLGLRRRQPVRADAAVRPARRFPPLRRSRPRRRPRRHSRRGLQPLRPRRQLPRPVLRDYFTDRYKNEWGEAINFDGPDCGPVREFFVANAGYWIDEFHIDGLRLDATQQIFDTSADHILAAVGRRVREAARGRATLIVAENEPQDVRIVRPVEKGGVRPRRPVERRLPPQRRRRPDRPQRGVLHRLSRRGAGVHLGRQVRLPLPGPALPVAGAAARHVHLGPAAGALRHLPRESRSGRQLGPRPAAAPPERPRPAPRPDGPDAAGAGDADAVPGPGIRRLQPVPLLRRPPGRAGPAGAPGPGRVPQAVPQPRRVRAAGDAGRPRRPARRSSAANSTFRSGKATRRYALHRDLLQLRREDPVFRAQKPRGVDGAVLAPEAFVLRFFGDGGDDRLLLVNLGRDLHLDPAPEPLLAPPENAVWDVLWSSEDPRYGGDGTAPPDTEDELAPARTRGRRPGAAAGPAGRGAGVGTAAADRQAGTGPGERGRQPPILQQSPTDANQGADAPRSPIVKDPPMDNLNRRMDWPEPDPGNTEPLLTREWLVTNGLGGYASGTVAGVATRRYHGLLIAALPAPLGRTMMLNHLPERVRLPDGTVVRFGGAECAAGALEVHGAGRLRNSASRPACRSGATRSRRRAGEAGPSCPSPEHRLRRLPARRRRGADPAMAAAVAPLPAARRARQREAARPGTFSPPSDGRYEISDGGPLPPLRLMLHGHGPPSRWRRSEARRSCIASRRAAATNPTGELWSPGYFRVDLAKGQDATLVASTESWETILALTPGEAEQAERVRRGGWSTQAPPEARTGLAGELVLAADQFIITPAGRVEDAARAQAAGDEVRTVIAGYHWFTDWGRDTMISLEGLTLMHRPPRRGRLHPPHLRPLRPRRPDPQPVPRGREARASTTPPTPRSGSSTPSTATSQATGDRATLAAAAAEAASTSSTITCDGTRFGIGVDPADGLLRQGAGGLSAHLDGRQGRRLGGHAAARQGGRDQRPLVQRPAAAGGLAARGRATSRPPKEIAGHAEQARASFNARFWYADRGYLYDVVDGEKGDDPVLPAQSALRHSRSTTRCSTATRWEPVLDVVRERLLTPVGLRSLAPGSPDYKPQLLRRPAGARRRLSPGDGLGLADRPVHRRLAQGPSRRPRRRARVPRRASRRTWARRASARSARSSTPRRRITPRGCIAQAWSVAEVLRAWVKTVP